MSSFSQDTQSQMLNLTAQLISFSSIAPENIKSKIKRCLSCDDQCEIAANFLLDSLRSIIKLNLDSLNVYLCPTISLCLDILIKAESLAEAVKIQNINRNIYHFLDSVLGLSNHSRIISQKKIPLTEVLQVVSGSCNFFSRVLSSCDSFTDAFWNEFCSITDNLSKFNWNIAASLKSPGSLADVDVQFYIFSIRFQCLCVKNDHNKFYTRCLNFNKFYNNSPKRLSLFFVAIWNELLKSCAQFQKHFQKSIPVDDLLNLVVGWFTSCLENSNIGNPNFYSYLVNCKDSFFINIPEDTLKESVAFVQTVWEILQVVLDGMFNKHTVSILRLEFMRSAPESQKLLLKCALYISQFVVIKSNEVKSNVTTGSLGICKTIFKFLPLVQWTLNFFDSTHDQQQMEKANMLFRGYAVCFLYALKEDDGSLSEQIITEHVNFFCTQQKLFTPVMQIQNVHYVLCSIASRSTQKLDVNVHCLLLQDLLSTILNFAMVDNWEKSGISNASDLLLKQYCQLSMLYTRIGLHQKALASLAQMSLLVESCAQTELMKKWVQLKICIYNSPAQAFLKQRSICEQLKLMGHSLSVAEEIQLLREELSGYRFHGYSFGLSEEIFATSSKLIILSKHDFHRALAVIDHCRSARFLKAQTEWNIENLCKLAVDTLTDHTVDPSTVNSVLRHFYLSLGFYELFHEKDKKLRSAIKMSGVSRNTESPLVKAIPKGDEEPSDNCDIQASLNHVTLISESECLRPLEAALVALEHTTVSLSKVKGDLDINIPDNITVINHAFILSECFMSAQRMHQSVRCLHQVLELSTLLGEKEAGHQATCSLMELLTRVGLPRQALLLGPKLDSSSSNRIRVQCNLANAEAHYFKGEFQIGFGLLISALCQLEEGSLHPKVVGKVLEIKARFLLVNFLSLSTTRIPSPDRESYPELGWKKVEEILKQPLVVIALDTLKICIRLIKSVYSTNDLSGMGWMACTVKPSLERYLLEGAQLAGKLYSHLGSLQEPRGILLEYLAVAQEQAAMIMSAQFLVKLAELDFLSGNQENCFVKCQGIRYLLTYNKVQLVCSDGGDKSPLESIFSKNLKNVLRIIDIDFPPSTTVAEKSASPCCKPELALRDINFHVKDCTCERCEYYAADLYILYSLKLEAECLALNGDHAGCYKMLGKVHEEFYKLLDTNVHKLNDLRSLLGKIGKMLNIKSHQFGFFKEEDLSYGFSFQVFFYQLALSISESLMQIKNFRPAVVYIDQTLTRMQKFNSLFCVLIPDIHSALIFQKSFSNLHLLAFEKGCPLSLLFHACSSRAPDNELKELGNEGRESDSEVLTPVNVSPVLQSKSKTSKWQRKVIPNAPARKVKFITANFDLPPVDFNKGSGGESTVSNKTNLCDTLIKTSPQSKRMPLIENKCDEVNYSDPMVCADLTKVLTLNYSNESSLEMKTPSVCDLKSKSSTVFTFPSIERRTETKTYLNTRSTRRLENKDPSVPVVSNDGKSEGVLEIHPKRNLRTNSKLVLEDKFQVLKSARKLRHTRSSQKENVSNVDIETDRCEDSPEQMRTGGRNLRPKASAKSQSNVLGASASTPVEELRNVVHSNLDLFSLSREINLIIKDTSDLRTNNYNLADTASLKATLDPIRNDLKECLIALSINPPALLYTRINLLLALLRNSNANEDDELTSAFHLSQSVGLTLRHLSLLACQKRLNEGCKNSAFAHELTKLIPSDKLRENLLSFKPLLFKEIPNSMRKLLDSIPEDWTVVQLCGSKVWPYIQSSRKTPDLMIGRFCKALPPSLALVTVEDPQFRKSLLKEFEEILDCSRNNSKEKDPKTWWSNRYSLEQRLQSLCEAMENVWLGCWKCLLLGQPTNPRYTQSLEQAVKQVLIKAKQLNLQCRSRHMLQCLLDGISCCKLNRAEVCSGLQHLFSIPASQLGPLFKEIQSMELNNFSFMERKPLILILEKTLINLPWESMPFLKGCPISRMPSFSFLEAHLTFHQNAATESHFLKGVDTSKTFYVLNPAKDLINTQKFFENKIVSEPGWNGLIAKVPTEEQAISAITNYDSFLYIGHGSGRVYLGKVSPLTYPCRAAVILMGCSSAKLNSTGVFSPSGIVLQYLMAGCPTVLGNLWDVTDKDIDKFTESLIETWFHGEAGNELSIAVSRNREICKLKYLIGAAPVVYGLPLYKH